MNESIPLIYRGSVKDIFGPVAVKQSTGLQIPDGLAFYYTDAFSVLDWGRMPDVLADKGHALSIMAAFLFEKLAQPDSWKLFSKTSLALKIRKEISLIATLPSQRSAWETALPMSLSSTFNEVGE